VVTHNTLSLGRFIGYINDIAVLIYNGELKRDLMENALYVYYGPLSEADIRAIVSAYTGVEGTVKAKGGRLTGQVTRASRLWTAFLVPFGGRTASGIMSLDIKRRQALFYIDVGFPSPEGQLQAVPEGGSYGTGLH
jgi:hypothetical protein